MKNPDALTRAQIGMAEAGPELYDWLKDRKNRRVIPHRLKECGYVPIRNDNANDGLWKINGARQVIYAKKTLSIRSGEVGQVAEVSEVSEILSSP